VALSDADKTEMEDIFAKGIAKGMAIYRSALEEEEAKLGSTKTPDPATANNGGGNDDDGFSLAGFILGHNK